MKHKYKVMISCALLLCTLVNVLSAYFFVSRSYMYIGVASPVLALIMFCGSNHFVLSTISFLWCVGFSLAFFISVIMTFFRKYKLFMGLLFADAVWYGVALLYALSIGSAGMPDFVLLCIGACFHVVKAICIWVKFNQSTE